MVFKTRYYILASDSVQFCRYVKFAKLQLADCKFVADVHDLAGVQWALLSNSLVRLHGWHAGKQWQDDRELYEAAITAVHNHNLMQRIKETPAIIFE